MRIPSFSTVVSLLLSYLVVSTHAERILVSNSLNTCSEETGFSASLFKIIITPNNNSVLVDMVAVISVEGMVVFDITINAYGYQATRLTVDPCDINLVGLCPMRAGKMDIPPFYLPVGAEAFKEIPGIAYSIPDLDATVRVQVNLTDENRRVACVEADISNEKTVDLIGVKWATAVIAGLALSASAVLNGLGHAHAAAHVAANALSLFGYFQALAMLGLTAVHLPPIVAAWTQDFMWSMGIIRVGFMQDIFTWYQRATGGTPSTLLDSLRTISVQVEKRSVELAATSVNLMKRASAMMPRAMMPRALVPRSNIVTGFGTYLVYGIQRVAYRAKIESTNLFLTCLTFFILFVIFAALSVVIAKFACDLLVKRGWMKATKFEDFRSGWKTILKGILFRCTLIGFPQMTLFCLWEFTQRDSAAEVVLAVFYLVGMLATLGWASFKVIQIGRDSVLKYQNPARDLFGDPQVLNKWGFLYIQYRATAYYFIVPMLGYLFVKALVVAVVQTSGLAQAIIFVILEAVALVVASVMRPWMDKTANTFNIAICAVNFINSVFLFIFTNVFGAPPLVVGVVGVVLFFLNAIFALILLLVLIVSTTLVFFRPNPDSMYQIPDDRVSFVKSQTQLHTTELNNLATTARGGATPYNADEDNYSVTSRDSQNGRASPYPVYPNEKNTSTSYGNVMSHVDSSQSDQHLGGNSMHSGSGSQVQQYPNEKGHGAVGYAPAPQNSDIPSRTASPYDAPSGGSPHGYASNPHAGYYDSPSAYRQQNNSSPWHRGAGYD